MIDPSRLGNLFSFFAAWGGAFIVTLWLSLIFWAWRDIRSRTGDRVLRLLAVWVVVALFLPGVVTYFALRPSSTLEEEYQKALEEEALLLALEDSSHCPGCSRVVVNSWLVCPDCHARIRKSCHHCSKLMDLDWNLCPHCGTPEPGYRKEAISLDEALRPTPSIDEDMQEEF